MRQAILITLTVLWATVGLGQNAGSDSKKSPKQADPDHGLVLKLSQDKTAVASANQDSLKACLADHPPLACKDLTLELRNEGTETVLRWFSSCHGENVTFEIRKEDGSWERFPQSEPCPCTRNVAIVRIIEPGESFVMHLKLADGILMLDTAYPKATNDQWVRMYDNKGYRLLTGPVRPTVRARWIMQGCIAAQGIHGLQNPFAGKSLCLGGREIEQEFVVLRSNALEMTIPAKP